MISGCSRAQSPQENAESQHCEFIVQTVLAAEYADNLHRKYLKTYQDTRPTLNSAAIMVLKISFTLRHNPAP